MSTLCSKTNKCMFNFNHVLCWSSPDPYLVAEADLCRGCCDTTVCGKQASLTPQVFAELGICSITPWQSLCMWGVKPSSLIENGSWDVVLCPLGSWALPGRFLCILCQIFFSLSKTVDQWTSWWYYIPALCFLAQLSRGGLHAVGGM